MKLKTLLIGAAALALPVAAWAVTTTGYEDFGDTAGVVLWRATEATFHNSTVIDVAEDGTLGTAYAMDANNGATSWQRFGSNQSGYSAPGKVLVYDKASSDDETPVDYTQNSEAQFSPLSFGGMWVKTLAANGSPFKIGQGGTRATEFGAAGSATLFKFAKSYTIDRQGAFTFNGTVNLDVAQDAVFSINETYPHQNLTVSSGSTLKPTGAGSITIGNTDNGLVVNGTLDLSATTVPTLDGDVTLGAESTIVLPANVVLPFTVCTGTLSVPVNVLVKVGDGEAEDKSLTVSGGAITAIDDPVYVFTADYPTVVPAGRTYTFVGGDTSEDVKAFGSLSVWGTLKTQGYGSIASYNSNASSVLEVETGSLTFNPGNYYAKGTVTIDAGATFVNAITDAIAYNGTFVVNVRGTLDMNVTRWSLGSNNTLNFHEGCTVTGSGQSTNGTFDWIEGATGTVNVYGEVDLQAPIKSRGATVNINVDAGANAGLTLSGDTIGSGTIVKKGAGLINFTTNPPYAITVENGSFTFDVDATPTITYASIPSGSMSMWYATQSTWKGTVVIDEQTGDAAAIPLVTYGNANSTIVLKGLSGSNNYFATAGGDVTVPATVQIDGNVTFNNGWGGNTYKLDKVTGGGEGITLTLATASGMMGLTYEIGELDYSGAIALQGNSTKTNPTFTFRIGNIVKAGAVAGDKVVSLTQSIVPATSTETINVDLSNTTLNGAAANLVLTSGGIYVAGGSATIGGVTTYYRGSSAAYMAVLSGGSAGDSFTVLDGADYGDLDGFEYNSETKTYTMLQMVAQFTNGVQTTKFATIAAACTAAEEINPVPTVELLVALGEQTVPAGWEYNTPEASGTTYGTLTKIVTPSDTYTITNETTLGTGGTITVPDGTTTIMLGSYDVTAGFNIDGTTATLLPPALAAEAPFTVGASTVTLKVTKVKGLFYGDVAAATLGGLTRPLALTQYTGDTGVVTLTPTKPEGSAGFFKVFVDIRE